MKKIGNGIKALIAVICVAVVAVGVVLGCVFGIKDNPTQENVYGFTAAQQKLADEINANVDASTTSYEITSTIPYDGICTIDQITDYADNYFIYEDEDDNNHFVIYQTNEESEIETKDLTDSSFNFVSGVWQIGTSENSDYVVFFYDQTGNSGYYTISIVYFGDFDNPVEVFNQTSTEENYIYSDEVIMFYDDCFILITTSKSMTTYTGIKFNAYFLRETMEELMETKFEKEFENISFSNFASCFKFCEFYWLFTNGTELNFITKLEDTFCFNSVTLNENYTYYDILKTSKNNFIISYKDTTQYSMIDEKTIYEDETYCNYHYESVEIASNGSVSVQEIQLEDGYAKIYVSTAGENSTTTSYIIYKRKIDENHLLTSEYLCTYFDESRNEIISYEASSQSYILYAGDGTFVTTESVLQAYLDGTNKVKLDLTGNDEYSLLSYIANDGYLKIGNSEGDRGVIDSNGNIVVDPSEFDFYLYAVSDSQAIGLHTEYVLSSYNIEDNSNAEVEKVNSYYIVNLKTGEKTEIEIYDNSSFTKLLKSAFAGYLIYDDESQIYKILNLSNEVVFDANSFGYFNSTKDSTIIEATRAQGTKVLIEVNSGNYSLSFANEFETTSIVSSSLVYASDSSDDEEISTYSYVTYTASTTNSTIYCYYNASNVTLNDNDYSNYVYAPKGQYVTSWWEVVHFTFGYDCGFNFSEFDDEGNPTYTLTNVGDTMFGKEITGITCDYYSDKYYVGIWYKSTASSVSDYNGDAAYISYYAKYYYISSSDGNSTTSETKTYIYGSSYTTPSLTSLSYDWSVVGWSNSTYDLSCGTSYVMVSSTVNLATIYYYAKYSRKPSVTLDSNKPSSVSSSISTSGSTSLTASTQYRECSSSSSVVSEVSVTLSSPYSLLGYTFSGWATSSSGSVAYSASATYTWSSYDSAKSVTLYAVWTANNYYVDIDANGGELDSSLYAANISSKTDDIICRVVRSSIKSYFYKNNSTQAYVAVAYVSELDMTGALLVSTSPEGVYYTYTEYLWYSETTVTSYSSFTYNGTTYYVCSTEGWCNGEKENAYQSTTPRLYITADTLENAAKKLIDSYKEEAYIIETYDTAFSVASPTRLGYTFSGWTISGMTTDHYKYYGTTSSTSTSIAKATTETTLSSSYNYFKNLCSTDEGTVSFTANWTVNTYTISYELNSGSYGSYHPTSVTYDEWFQISNPERVGYTFSGWSISGMTTDCTHYYGSSTLSYSTTSSSSISSTKKTYYLNLRSSSGTVTFTASWTANTYYIIYDIDGDGVSDDVSSYSDLPTSATYDEWFYAAAPTKTGYTFDGWYIGATIDSYYYHMTAYLDKYYSSDNGSTYGTIYSASCIGGATVGSGYLYFKNLCSGGFSSTEDNTVGFQATWTANTYTISFVYNSDLTSDTSTTATYDSWKDISSFIGTKTGYTFSGWTITGMTTGHLKYYGASSSSTLSIASDVTSRTISSTSYVYYKNLCSTDGGTVTFTAVWTANTYYIKYDINVGTHGTTHPTSAKYDNAFFVSDPSRTGYTFIGWSFSNLTDSLTHYYGTNTSSMTSFTSTNGRLPDTDNVNYDQILDVSYFMNLAGYADKAETITLVANWQANQYTITYYYMPSSTDALNTLTETTTLNLVSNMTLSLTQTVTFDQLFTTYGAYSSGDESKQVVLPTGVVIKYWVVSTSKLSSSTSTVVWSGDVSSSYTGESYDLLEEVLYGTYGQDIYFYAAYEFIQTTVRYYVKSSTSNSLADYILYSTDTVRYSSYYTLPSVDGVIGWQISRDYFTTGTLTDLSVSTFVFESTSYIADCGTIVAWPYSNLDAYDSSNPIMYCYAVYDTGTYSVSYNLGGGTVATSSSSVAVTDWFVVSNPTLTGYTFTGWTITGYEYDLSSGSYVECELPTGLNHFYGTSTSSYSYSNATSLSVGTSYTYFSRLAYSGDTVRFTASWTANTYKISYTLNSGSYGTYYPTSATYGTGFTVSNPTRSGYTFAGWTISGMTTDCTHYYGSSSSSLSYSTSSSITTTATYFKNLTSTRGGTVTFTANWTATVTTATITNNTEFTIYTADSDSISSGESVTLTAGTYTFYVEVKVAAYLITCYDSSGNELFTLEGNSVSYTLKAGQSYYFN